MLVFRTVEEIQRYLKNNKIDTIGFVATMGALHRGHISLIETSTRENSVTICSIFVNPKQFNKKEDLVNYPRETDLDIEMLRDASCDIVFIPSAQEMYPEKLEKEFDFGVLSEVMEAKHRPGHFNGVAIVIERFFNILNPTRAYFGEKDYQQLAVIRALAKQLNSTVEIVGCPIHREENGLAMSSRNKRLTREEKDIVKTIKEGLDYVKENHHKYSISTIKKHFRAKIAQHKELSLEYFEIANKETLELIQNWQDASSCIAFTAINVRTVRLIDNMTIIG